MQRVSMDACPACKHANPPSARYCSACGTALVMRCPACNTINTRTRRQCHHCRTSLHGDATEPTRVLLHARVSAVVTTEAQADELGARAVQALQAGGAASYLTAA